MLKEKIHFLRQSPVVCTLHVAEFQNKSMKLTSVCMSFTHTIQNMEGMEQVIITRFSK